MKLRRSSKGARGEYAMSASMPDAPTAPQTIGEWILYIVAHTMFVLVDMMGVAILTSGVRQFLGAGEIPLPVAALLTVVGAIFIAIGFGFFYVRYVKQPLWDEVPVYARRNEGHALAL